VTPTQKNRIHLMNRLDHRILHQGQSSSFVSFPSRSCEPSLGVTAYLMIIWGDEGA
jgi:hypothetical protein